MAANWQDESLCEQDACLFQQGNDIEMSRFASLRSDAQGYELSLGDEFLADLARDLETEEDAEALGRSLGFGQGDINRFMATNRMTNRVTCKGTRDMLFAWRQLVTPPDQPRAIRDALLKAGLRDLSEQYCGRTRGRNQSVTSVATVGGLPCCFEEHIRTIRSHYKMVICQIHRRPWDPDDFTDLKHLFTDITLFKYDRSTGEVKKTALDGSVNGIFSTRVNGELPTRILLVAPGGHGKTCAVAKLAYDWVHQVEGSSVKDMQALIVLKLREVEASMGLGEAILSQLIGIDHGVTPESVERFLEEHQDSCALICDGYDEYKGSIKTSDLSNSLVMVLRNKKLKNLRVMVTTRPFLEGDFLQGELARTYSKMVIEGFTSGYAEQYITRYFSAKSMPTEGEYLIGHIRKNAFLRNLIQVPLFCTMVCHLTEVDALSDAHSMTSLFDHVNQFLLQHALAKETPLLPSDEKLDDILRELGRFAFEGLRGDSQKLVFTEEDFRCFNEAYRVGVKLGILSSTRIPVKHLDHNQQTTRTTVEFFHKMEQEYCASVYLRSIDNKRRDHRPVCTLRIFKQSPSLKVVLERSVGTVARLLEFENVLCILAGASRSACAAVFKHIARQVKDFVIYYKCRLVLHCLTEAEPSYVDEKVERALCRCFWNGQLDLYPLTERIMIGLERLPQKAKAKITLVLICSTPLTPEMTARLWSCMALFCNLHHLYLNNSSVSVTDEQDPIQPLPSVRKFEAWNLEEDTFCRVVRCLPGLEELVVWIGNEFDIDHSVAQIARGVEVAGETLQWVVINGLLNGLRVSRETFAALGRTVSVAAKKLESLHLVEVKMEGEEGMVAMMQECATSQSLKEIRLLRCGLQSGGALHAFLDNLGSRSFSSPKTNRSRGTADKNTLCVTAKDGDDEAITWRIDR